MVLASGTRLGVYEVLTAIGAGGMGEVYRARDTKLQREVAIKVLPPVFATDPERLARFEREAQVLASINHPNIAHVHGLEESGETRAIVMELVEGDDLAQRLARGPLPFAEALPIAKQIADALEAAHDLGIIHRDLKPANIKVRDDGTVKVLDFGLAKALDPGVPSASSLANSPTLTLHATQVGIILGTAAYMAPEQAHGRAADRRADIFAFGAVFFEMLTGKQAFTGESVSDTLASVLKIDPDWSQVPADVPAHVRTLLRRCLTKDRAQRLQAIGEARIVLAQPPGTEPTGAASGKPSQVSIWALAAALVLVTGVAIWSLVGAAPPPPRPTLRFTDAASVASVPGAIALSRDGTRLAFVGGPGRQIYVRSLKDQFAAVAIPRTENATALCFSPDGKRISYLTTEPSTLLMTVDVDGGPPRKLADVSVRLYAGRQTVSQNWLSQTWADDGSILFGTDGGLSRIPADGGPVQVLVAPPDAKSRDFYLAPQLRPGGTHVLVTVSVSSVQNTNRIVVLDLQSHQQKVLFERFGSAHYVPSTPGSPSGHLVSYDAATGSLSAVAFDAARHDVTGAPVPILDGVRSVPGYFGLFATTDSGMLAYVPGGSMSTPERTLVWLDRRGNEQPTGAQTRQFNSPTLSPTGDRAAVEIQGTRSTYIFDLRTGSPTQFAPAHGALWMPDGNRLIFAVYDPSRFGRSPQNLPNFPTLPAGALVMAPADRSAPPTILGQGLTPRSISPDGRYLLVTTESGISVVPLTDPASKPWALLPPDVRPPYAAISPDGNWLAYSSSNAAGRSEVYVTAFPRPGATYTVSDQDGGIDPHWNPNPNASTPELFYRNGDKMMVVTYEKGRAFRRSHATELFTRSMFRDTYRRGWDVAPDGQRFLMVKHLALAAAGEATRLNIVLNWQEELKARVPIK